MLQTILLAAAVSACAPSAKTDVILDAHPDWINLRNRAIDIARTNYESPGEGWAKQLSCVPKLGIIWQWDSCFMALYAGYTPDALHGLGNLDNLYRMQAPDGYVSMAYNYADRQPTYGERINPPLYAWVEWLYARRTGDLSRLPRAYEAASRLFRWTKEHRRRENGLYWFEDAGSSGMDNSPRSGWQADGLKGSDVAFVDLSCQQVLAARCLAKIAPLVGKAEEAAGWEKEATEIAALVNRLLWDEKTGFYYDAFMQTSNIFATSKLANKTAAAFWAIVSGVADDAQVARLADHLTNPKTFGARHPVPALSKDDPNYRADGGYWCGGVWPPVQYMVCRGLRERGWRPLAREIAKKHLACQTELLGTKDFDSVWECYSPDLAQPCRNKRGKWVRPNFVGWGGIGPFVLLVEDVLGLDIAALDKKVAWHLSEKGRQGLTDIPFNGGRISLDCTVTDDATFAGTVTGDRECELTVTAPDGVTSVTVAVKPGETRFASPAPVKSAKPFRTYNIFPCRIGEEASTAAMMIEEHRRTGSDIALYSLSFHPEGYPAKDKAETLVDSYRKVRKALEGSDVKLGVLIQSVIGHWPRVDQKLEDWQRSITFEGKVWRFCVRDPGFRAYIRDFCRALAAEKPALVLGDDDIKQLDECFCPLHTAEFNRRAGTNYTPEEYRKAVMASKPGEKTYEIAFALRDETVESVPKLIRASLDEVDPTVPGGMCMSGGEYRYAAGFARLIAAKGQRPMLRVANDGHYREFQADDFPDLVQRTLVYRSLWDDIDLFDESDTFPHNAWNRSVACMDAKLSVCAFSGMDGGLLWLVGAKKWDYPVYEGYTDRLEARRSWYQAAARLAQATQPMGFIVPVNTAFPDWHYDRGREWFTDNVTWVTRAGAQFGVPFAYTPDLDVKGAVYTLAGRRTVQRFTDDQLKTLLAGKLLVDADAARELAKRGFDKLLGVTVEERDFNYGGERDVATSAALPFYKKASAPAPFLTPLEGAERLSDLTYKVGFKATDKPVVTGVGSTFFVNALGGRIIVTAYSLDLDAEWHLQRFARYSEPRKAWFLSALDKLNGKPLPIVVTDNRDILALAREGADGTRALFVCNTNRDPLDAFTVRVDRLPKKVLKLTDGGVWCPARTESGEGCVIVHEPLSCYNTILLKFID